MKVHIHGNCQSYVLGGMLGEVFPNWDITWSEVHTDEIIAENEEYRRRVATADLVLSQPIHRGFREREDLSLDWVRGAVRDDAMLLVFPSMHFTGHHPSRADLDLPGIQSGDAIAAILIAGGIDPESAVAMLTSTDLLSEDVVREELRVSIAESDRRDVDDAIDIRLSPLLEIESREQQLFHIMNHPGRLVYVFVLNEILMRLGFGQRASPEGKDWQAIPHLPPLPAVGSYLARIDDAASGLVLLPGQDPMTQRRYYQAMTRQFAECPAGVLLEALAGRTWQRDFLGRLTTSITGGQSPAADALTHDERVEAARRLATELAALTRRTQSARAPRICGSSSAHDGPMRGDIGATLSGEAGNPQETEPGTSDFFRRRSMLAKELMHRLYGTDIYDGFTPPFPEDLQGWNSQAGVFVEAIETSRPAVIFDVGVWKGGSSVFLAESLRQQGLDAAVISIDNFLGSAENWEFKPGTEALLHRRHGFPVLYEQFLSNVVLRRLQDYIVPLPQTTAVAAEILRICGISADIIHLDAAHDYESTLADAHRYWELLSPGGWLIGDDYHPTWPGVVRAADEFAVLHQTTIRVSGAKWVIRKPGPNAPGESAPAPSAADASSEGMQVETVCGPVAEGAAPIGSEEPDGRLTENGIAPTGLLPSIANSSLLPPVRWEAELIAQVQAEADDDAPADRPVRRQLRDIMARAGRGEPVSELRRRLEDVATECSAMYPGDPWFYENYGLACMTAGAFDLASQLVRDRFQASWSCEPGIQVAGNPPSVVRWNVVSHAQSRFSFEPEAFVGQTSLGVPLLWLRTVPLYDAYHRSHELECGSVNVSLFDAGVASGIAFCSNRPDNFLVPDIEYLFPGGHPGIRAQIDAHARSWEERQPVAYWRGGTTGHWDWTDWHTLPRIRLCEIAAASGGLLDAGLSGIVQMEPRIADEIKASGLFKGPVPMTRFADYRYLVDIDGNSNSWSGLFCRLYTGSTVLKVDSPFNFRLWFYDRLVPWFNYVPVASDMSDLVEKVTWLLRNDETAQDIGRRGRELAASLDHETELMGSARVITAALRQDAFLRSR